MKLSPYYIICCMMWWNIGDCLFLGGSECKVFIDNKHSELKQLIGEQNKFSVNNWSHVSAIIILALLCILVIMGYCYCKAKYWPAIKNIDEKPLHKQYSKPYIIQVGGKDNSNNNGDKEDAVE